LINFFQNPLADNIKRTPIICSQDNDILCWRLTPSGKCNSKSAYRACLNVLQEHGEPTPRQVTPTTIQLLNQIWKNPRVQTFGWRLIRKAMPTGARAGKYSKHISKFCCRCGLQEDDTHLFFLCAFAKAAWFSHPWYLKIDQIVANHNNMAQILLHILSMAHPYASLENILTFMWCLWKARNDCLFNRKDTNPKLIFHKANAIHNNMELLDVLQGLKNRYNS
jgi:hypothetical protein